MVPIKMFLYLKGIEGLPLEKGINSVPHLCLKYYCSKCLNRNSYPFKYTHSFKRGDFNEGVYQMILSWNWCHDHTFMK